MQVELHPATVLHRRDYRDSSLLIELFSRDHGRIGAVARGARKRWQGVIEPFSSLLVSWRGRGELLSLNHAESVGPARHLHGRSIACAFYTNELLLRMTRRHDPHPELFQRHNATLDQLAAGANPEPVLRLFERDLLHLLGYGLDLEQCSEDGAPLRRDTRYRYLPQHGAVYFTPSGDGVAVDGATLLALHEGGPFDAAQLAQLKGLMRSILAPHVGQRPLHSRELARWYTGQPRRQAEWPPESKELHP